MAEVKAESEARGALVDHIDRYFMDPTPVFSAEIARKPGSAVRT
jgi:hypothetical protein